MEGKLMAVPIYVWNGTAWESTGPTIPANPIKYQASAPSSPSTGDIWVDSDADVTTGSQQFQRFRFVASGGETTISGADANGATLAYTAGAELVVLNGSTLVRGQDYTATNGTTITGLSPALVASDVLEVFSFIAFTVANTYTQSQSDGLFALKSNFSTTYTPTVTQGVNVTKTVNLAKYKQDGKVVTVCISMGLTSAGTAGSNVEVSIPVTAVYGSTHPVGSGVYYRSSGNVNYAGTIYLVSTTTVALRSDASSFQSFFGNQPNLATANIDGFDLTFTYEAA